MNEGLLSVKNASGRQVSLLNTAEEESKRKYHCTEPGCNKSFTTSGHLARHNRIHTGEKNFPCLFPGCQSRFSRQDNMMQHYRTHMSPKSRRSQKRQANTQTTEETRPKPRLHAHQRIRSDPVQIEPPLTIDQHLSNYHQSLQTIPNTARFNQFPLPLSTVAKTSQVSSPTLSSASSSTNNQPVAETCNQSFTLHLTSS
ncbi:Putative Acetylcholinesterase [Rhizopus microsporus]|nr:Putative Acetylcholinesterase [Rhizopus microsporus]